MKLDYCNKLYPLCRISGFKRFLDGMQVICSKDTKHDLQEGCKCIFLFGEELLLTIHVKHILYKMLANLASNLSMICTLFNCKIESFKSTASNFQLKKLLYEYGLQQYATLQRTGLLCHIDNKQKTIGRS
jgi:hypothetical protein